MTTKSFRLPLFLAFSWVAAAMLLPVAAHAAPKLEESVVRLVVSKQSVDKGSPWQFEGVNQQAYQGIVVDPRHVLTTAFAAADATFIEMQRFGDSRKVELKPSFVDYEVNLALLEAEEGELSGLKPLPLADDLELGDKVDVYKTRDSDQLSKFTANLQEVGIFGAVTSAYTLASYLFKVQQTELGWAEPVLIDGRLAALATGQNQNYMHAIPSSLIRHFLEDKHDSSYRGFPSLGIQLSALTSPDMRKLLKAEGVKHGVRISQVTSDSDVLTKLKVDDVLLEVDGVEISEHGFYTHPKWGKIHVKYLLNQRYGGDKVKLKILRDGKEMMVEGTLSRFDSNRAPVIAYRYGEKEPHLIFGGIVFQELTRPFLQQWGRDWRDIAPYQFLYLYENGNDPVPDKTEHVIILNRVLADEFNRGYGEMRYEVLETVNDRKVKNLDELRQVLQSTSVNQAGKKYAQFRFKRGGGEIILAYEGLTAAHRRIAREYKIDSPSSFFRPEGSTTAESKTSP